VRQLVFTVQGSVIATTMGTLIQIQKRKNTLVLATTSIMRDTLEPRYNSRSPQLFATIFVKTTIALTPSTRKKVVKLKMQTKIHGALPPSTLRSIGTPTGILMILRSKNCSKKMNP